MNAARTLAICFSMLLSTSVSAQQNYPALSLPNPSSPPVVAFMAWHQSLLKGDFDAYKNLSFSAPNVNEDLKRQMFDFVRASAPTVVKITEQKTNPNGSIGFLAVGCKDDRRLLSLITVVGNPNGAWQVAATGWSLPWNETAKLCPV